MREALLVAIGYLLLVLQVTICPAIAVTSAGIQPDLVVLAMVFLALYARSPYAFLGCTALGLARDLAASGPLGPFTIVYTVIGYVLSRLRRNLYRENIVILMLVVLLAAAVSNWAAEALGLVVARQGANPFHMALKALAVGLYSALLTPPLFWMLRRVARVLGMAEGFRTG